MSEVPKDKNIAAQWLLEPAEPIINHMNSDHASSIVASLNAFHEIMDKDARMVKLEVIGYNIKSKDKQFFIPFLRDCKCVEEYKAELIKQAQLYRSFEF